MYFLLGGQFYVTGFEVDPDPDRIRVPLDQSIRIRNPYPDPERKNKISEEKSFMFEELFVLFNCKFLVITNQNLDLDPDSQKSLCGMDAEQGCQDATHFISQSCLCWESIKVHVRRTCLPVRLPSGLPVCPAGCPAACPAACQPARLPVSLSGYLSACSDTGLSACPPACESARLPVSLPSYLSACPGWLSVCPATSQHARLPVSLPGYLSALAAACQLARLPVSLPSYLSFFLCLSIDTLRVRDTTRLPAQLAGRWGQMKWNSVLWGKNILYWTGPTREAKAGQKSLLPARRA